MFGRVLHRISAVIFLSLVSVVSFSQEKTDDDTLFVSTMKQEEGLALDSVSLGAPLDTAIVDSAIRRLSLSTMEEEQKDVVKVKERWIPNPKKAMWLAIAFPGGGQIYNRKYWKLPIFYGGFLGCFYALNWNNTMYRDYSQAYIDIMDSDENTKSYMNFIPAGYNVESNLTRLQDQFKRKKNYFRRYRDMSLFCMIGVYLISIVDAYVDAEMSSFDISRDLSVKVTPAVINDRSNAMRTPSLNGNSYGVNCRLNF